MIKTNFTKQEMNRLNEVLGSRLKVSINRAGNVKVVNEAESLTHTYWGKWGHGFWVLYKYNNGTYLWRRHDGTGYSYPLNMKGRKVAPGFEYYRPYNVSMSLFNSFDEALDYFINYLNRYRNINL